jgi:ketosteroid isomerase-like protein
MKSLRKLKTIPVLLFFSIFILSQSCDKSKDQQLMKEFQLQTEKWKQAYNSLNAQNLIALYSEDAQYISSHVAGLVENGRNDLITNFQNGMNMGGKIDSVEILRMDVSGNLATLLCKYQATNAGVTVIGRNLLVLKKIKGKWLITIHMTVV